MSEGEARTGKQVVMAFERISEVSRAAVNIGISKCTAECESADNTCLDKYRQFPYDNG